MIVPFFDLGTQVSAYRSDLHSKLDQVIDSGQFIGGDIVSDFESNFADYVGTKHCVGVGNGLDALRLCLEVNNIGHGDEVIVPAFTFYATWLAILQAGATPVPVDVAINTANIDASLIEQAITLKTKAIIAVHLYGWSANMTQLSAIAKRNNLLLFEDAAQSHGSMHCEKMTGSWGDMSAFSFYPTKNLGALGDAGCITTDDESLADSVRSKRSYGQGASKYDHISTGWNTRLDPLQAAFLDYHLTRIDEWTSIRREIATAYTTAALESGINSLGPATINDSVWHHFVIRVKNRVQAQEWFASKGISTDIHYPYAAYMLDPIKPFLGKSFNLGSFPVSDELSRTVLSLPIGPWMTPGQIAKVTGALLGVPADFIIARKSDIV
jgi:dTDP-4-amino-4,6-dideoxygalactose transaminase